jgi:hypothetical protein
MNHNSKKVRLGEKLEAAHKAKVPPRSGGLQTAGFSSLGPSLISAERER